MLFFFLQIYSFNQYNIHRVPSLTLHISFEQNIKRAKWWAQILAQNTQTWVYYVWREGTRVLAFMNCENKQHQPIHSFIQNYYGNMIWSFNVQLSFQYKLLQNLKLSLSVYWNIIKTRVKHTCMKLLFSTGACFW